MNCVLSNRIFTKHFVDGKQPWLDLMHHICHGVIPGWIYPKRAPVKVNIKTSSIYIMGHIS